MLSVGAATTLGLVVPATASASTNVSGNATASTNASTASAVGRDAEILHRLRRLEQQHAARLGVFAFDSATGRHVGYRDQERFAICSVFKTVLVAAVLRDLDRDGTFLAERIRYTDQDVARSGYAPITGRPENLAQGMTVADLCGAAITHSDNTAANLLLRALGGRAGEAAGPYAVTRFCRSVGDVVTRLDRPEPDLNSAEPGRDTDITSPRAIARTYARLTLGTALEPADRTRLGGWLLANTTGGNRIRAGLPPQWSVADKTGTGGYGTTNDVAIVRPPGRDPLVLAVFGTKPDAHAPADEPLLAEAATLVAAHLT
ncbi:class A beta-lactamase [Embleya sp. NPDC050493]|uniref:class A beta-lactamase n=1 Tax=Embleya sp. NPDC050493 TaxID=3363989 RepID=UPI00379A5709